MQRTSRLVFWVPIVCQRPLYANLTGASETPIPHAASLRERLRPDWPSCLQLHQLLRYPTQLYLPVAGSFQPPFV
jgi:hypothetical protein